MTPRLRILVLALLALFALAAPTGCKAGKLVDAIKQTVKENPERSAKCKEPGKVNGELCKACCEGEGSSGYLYMNGDCKCL